MEFDQYAEQYDAGFMGKGSTRFYRDLIRELEIRDGNAVLEREGTVLTLEAFPIREAELVEEPGTAGFSAILDPALELAGDYRITVIAGDAAYEGGTVTVTP